MEADRRGWVAWLLGGGLASSLASFVYPVLRFVNPPETSEAPVNEVAAGKTTDLPVNSAKMVRFGSRPVLLIRSGEAEWRAFDGTCTHLNCTVQYQREGRQIWCACHNGFYDLNGKVVSGPPPRALAQYEVHVRGEDIVISKRG
jgi:cytochrome b6-f complex iron-sulfur subunit